MAEATPVRLKSLDGIPEPLQALFAVVGDGDEAEFEFRPPPSKTAEDVQRTQNALRKERERAAQLAKQLEELKGAKAKIVVDDEEVDEETIQALYREKKKQAGQQTLTREEADRLAEERAAKKLKAREESHKTELEQERRAREELQATLERVLIDDRIRAAATDPALPFRLRPEAVDDLVALVRREKLAKVDGDRVVPLDGDQPLTDAKGEDASLGYLIQHVVQAYKKPHWVYDSQGTGAPPASNGNGAIMHTGTLRRSQMSTKEKCDYTDKYGDSERRVHNVPCYQELPLR